VCLVHDGATAPNAAWPRRPRIRLARPVRHSDIRSLWSEGGYGEIRSASAPKKARYCVAQDSTEA